VIVVATKLDATMDHTRLDTLREYCRRHNLEFHSISAATGDGVKDLVRAVADALDKIPRATHDATLDTHDNSGESLEHSPARVISAGGAEVDHSERAADENHDS
jgi:GTPase involved in cell partitioning and DNA repair